MIKETIDGCARILRNEISHLRPTHIVFVTNKWWYAPIGIDEEAFSREIGIKINDNQSVIVGSGTSRAFYFSPKVVITKRPESAGISREEHAKAIFDAFAALEYTDQKNRR